MRAGYPLYDVVGAYAHTWVGYRGVRQTLFDLSNLLASQRKEIPPYRSWYWQDTPRAAEIPGAAAHCIS
jgi:nitrogenase molybdenum-iron protein alpha/beta subunit